jgi:hypothetical protein
MMVRCTHVISMVSERSFADIDEDRINVNYRICLRTAFCSKFHLYVVGNFFVELVSVSVILRSRHKMVTFSILGLGGDTLMTSIAPISRIKVLDLYRR